MINRYFILFSLFNEKIIKWRVNLANEVLRNTEHEGATIQSNRIKYARLSIYNNATIASRQWRREIFSEDTINCNGVARPHIVIYVPFLNTLFLLLLALLLLILPSFRYLQNTCEQMMCYICMHILCYAMLSNLSELKPQ